MKHFLVAALLGGALLLAGTAEAQQSYFPPVDSDTWDTWTTEELGWCPDELTSLQTFLTNSNSRGFMVLYQGKVAIEWYLNGHTAADAWYWASAGKSLTAFLVGLAQEQELLNIENPVSTYLGSGWTSLTTEQEEAILVRHLLEMSSGLDDGVTNRDCTDPACLQYLAEPGTRWAYHNGPYTLLGEVIAAATGSTRNLYLAEQLHQTIGTSGVFLAGNEYNRLLWSNLRSMGRFGLLALHQGDWDGQAIMTDKAFFSDMISPQTTMNPGYGYLWWLNSQTTYKLPGFQIDFDGPTVPDAPADTYAAMGKNGQLIFCVPSLDMVVVRVGDNPSDDLVPIVYTQNLWTEFEKVLTCVPVSAEATNALDVVAFPNPAEGEVQFDRQLVSVTLTNTLGQQFALEGAATRWSLEGLAPGVYAYEASSPDGATSLGRLVVR